MAFNVTSFVLGVAIGSLFTVAIAYPRVGRIFTRTLAGVLLSAGAGLLTWAIDAVVRGDQLTPIVCDPVSLSEPSEAFGWGAGLLLGGVAALVLSFVGRSD